ncbi:MAG: complex I subunit 4 family protein [Candidatus Dormibacteria bacterium]
MNIGLLAVSFQSSASSLPSDPGGNGPNLLLSSIVWLPLLGAILILFLPSRTNDDHGRIKSVAAIFTAVPLLLALFAFWRMYTGISQFTYSGGFQYVENVTWIRSIGSAYHIGVDGISMPLVLLSTILFFVAVLASFNQQKRVKEYFFLLLVLDIGVTGVFTAMDYLLFFIFWEIELIPMFLLIMIWGGQRRVYAAWKFLLFTITSSAFLFIAILVMYFRSGLAHPTFDMETLSAAHFSPVLAGALFWLFFLCFAIKLPVFPLHTWLPDAHVEAPTAMSVLLAGVLLKMGGYGMIRVCVGAFPGAAKHFSVAILVLGVIGVIWGGLAALAQDDMKRMVAYSSVSHMGFVLVAISALTPLALSGAVFQLFAHGVITGALFLLVGLVYDRTHTRSIRELGGLAQRMPYLTVAWVIAAFASVGLPGFAGFIAEFEIFTGSVGVHRFGTFVAVFGVVLSAGYLLWMLERVFFGPIKENWGKLRDPNPLELGYMAFMIFVIFLAGVAPGVLNSLISFGINPISARLTGA